MKKLNSVRVTTLVDNDVWKSGLMSSWGISLYVETYKGKEQHTVLMDTSGSFDTLSNNASKLDMNLSDVEVVFISHWHGDHCGSLSHVLPLLRRSTSVYVPSENSSGMRKTKEAGGTPMICSELVELMEGVISTGEMVGRTSEHSLVMNVENKGLVILTGCGHPGIVNIIERAQQVSGVYRVHAVIGGFHISVREALETANLLRKIGVELVSPCHCTSENVKKAVSNIMGTRCVKNGSGKIFSIG